MLSNDILVDKLYSTKAASNQGQLQRRCIMPDTTDIIMAGIIGEIILDEEDEPIQPEQEETDLFYEPYPGEGE
jgi:hypothetical protein